MDNAIPSFLVSIEQAFTILETFWWAYFSVPWGPSVFILSTILFMVAADQWVILSKFPKNSKEYPLET